MDTISLGLVKRRVKAILATEGPRSYEKAGDRVDSETSGSRPMVYAWDIEDEETGTGEDFQTARAVSVESLGGLWSASQEEAAMNEGDGEVGGDDEAMGEGNRDGSRIGDVCSL